MSEYKNHTSNNLYSSVMDIIVKANERKFEEVADMCDALKEIYLRQNREAYEKEKQEAIDAALAEQQATMAEQQATLAEQQALIVELRAQLAAKEKKMHNLFLTNPDSNNCRDFPFKIFSLSSISFSKLHIKLLSCRLYL